MQRLKENDAENRFVAMEEAHIKSWNRLIKVFCSGLIAVNLLIIQGYISLASLDVTETISLYIFTITLPLIILCVVVCIFYDGKYPWSPYPFPRAHISQNPSTKSELYSNIFIFSSTVNLFGVIVMFFHFSMILGFLFFTSTFIAFLLLVFSEAIIAKRKNKP